LERYLYPSRGRLKALVVLFILWLMFTAASTPTRRSGAGMLGFLCLLGLILSASSLVPGATWLKLDSNGFTVRFWFRENTYRWIDIKEFKVMTYRWIGLIPVRRSVCFRFSDSYPRNALSRIAGAFASFDRNLPDNYGMKAKELAALLELCRREAVGADANRYQLQKPAAIEPK
jgi:hypothetical protein